MVLDENVIPIRNRIIFSRYIIGAIKINLVNVLFLDNILIKTNIY